MGSFKAKVVSDDNEFDVRWFKVAVDRGINAVGKVTTSTRGGIGEFRVPSNDSTFWAEKMVTCEHTPFKLSIEISAAEHTGKMKTIEMEDCVLIGYNETFDADSEQEASVWCRVTCNTMTIGNAQLISNWTNNA
jgi:hypothetical protein